MANRARERPLYLARVAVYTAIRVEPWGITHLIPFGMEVLFYFTGTDIPKSVIKRNLKNRKGKIMEGKARS